MRKRILLICSFCIALIIFAYMYCSRTEIQKAVGVTYKQNRIIEEWLEMGGVTYETVCLLDKSIINDISDNYTAYELIDKDGNHYIMILCKKNKAFEVVLDADGTIRSGLISNNISPTLYNKAHLPS